MMPIAFNAATLTEDEVFKQNAALKQMKELIDRLGVGKKYRTLMKADRNQLLKEGYAKELVDNLVYVTERYYDKKSSGGYQDEIETGFNYAAFDPSLFASQTILKNVRKLSSGLCYYCESDLSQTNSGSVTHFRPVCTLMDNGELRRSPYYQLAYNQNNLHYSCPACAEHIQAGVFPVAGKRNPTQTFSEAALLLDPFTDATRDFIRFNPKTGEAYAFDLVSDFYHQTQGQTKQQTEQNIWNDPELIPDLNAQSATASPVSDLNQRFEAWIRQRDLSCYKGLSTINTFKLNRPALVTNRNQHAIYLNLFFDTYKNELTESIEDEPLFLSWFNKNRPGIRQYFSFSFDTLKTFLFQQKKDNDVRAQLARMYTSCNTDAATDITPSWIQTTLLYIVFESELTLKNKRRIVHLSADDYLYGSDNKEKCIFLPINWDTDTGNLIKVKSKKHIWETSFSELAASRPLEVRNLFSGSEVWAEGDYPALT